MYKPIRTNQERITNSGTNKNKQTTKPKTNHPESIGQQIKPYQKHFILLLFKLF